MRCESGNDQVVPGKSIEECGGAREAVRRCLRVRYRKADDRLAEDAAQARLLRRAGNFLFEVVHVRVRRRPGFNHLEGGEPRSRPHELGRDRLGLGGKDVLLQPVHEREIVREPAVQDHRGVRVRVDEAGHDGLAGGVNRLRRSKPGRNRVGGIDGDDVAAVHRDRPGRQDTAGRIDGDDDPAGDDERDGPARDLGRKQCGGGQHRRGNAQHGRVILSRFSFPFCRSRFV